MKTYISPKCEVIKFSLESLLALSNYNKKGDEGDYSEKRGGWNSSAWTAGDGEEE